VPALRDVVLQGSSNSPEAAEEVAAYMRWVADAASAPAAASKPPTRGKATAEVVMDVELAGAVAPGAELVVYFAPDSESGVYQVMQRILDDGTASVVSFSWAWEERRDSLEKLISELLAQAADPGGDRPPITFCAASGDYGGAKVCFPAASPWALACGGTRVTGRGAEGLVETVWNTRELGAASGGGVSSHTPQPKWQAGLEPSSGRGVPDVAAVADPASHCRIHAGGVWGPAGGTSAAAPVWAGLVAVLNQALGSRQGYLNPRLYTAASRRPQAFRSVTTGDNLVAGAGFEARKGWDPCTGLGTPSGRELLAALRPA
jgi:kumamolisin